MAVPQNRQSKSRRDKRRAQWKAKFKAPNFSVCPNCQEPKLRVLQRQRGSGRRGVVVLFGIVAGIPPIRRSGEKGVLVCA